MSAQSPTLMQRYGYTLAERDGGWICRYCGRRLNLPEEWFGAPQRATIDHVIPRSRGGSNDLSNLVLCCATCNASKNNNTFEEWIAIQWVKAGAK